MDLVGGEYLLDLDLGVLVLHLVDEALDVVGPSVERFKDLRQEHEHDLRVLLLLLVLDAQLVDPLLYALL